MNATDFKNVLWRWLVLLMQASYTPIPFFLTLSLGELAEYVEMASKKPR